VASEELHGLQSGCRYAKRPARCTSTVDFYDVVAPEHLEQRRSAAAHGEHWASGATYYFGRNRPRQVRSRGS
jgi:hypothetical protein